MPHSTNFLMSARIWLVFMPATGCTVNLLPYAPPLYCVLRLRSRWNYPSESDYCGYRLGTIGWMLEYVRQYNVRIFYGTRGALHSS